MISKLSPLVLGLFTRKAAASLAKTSAGYVVIKETVEMAADYNDWVAENQNFIINFASIGALGGRFIKAGSVVSTFTSLIRNPKAWIAGISGGSAYAALESLDFRFERSYEVIDDEAVNTYSLAWSDLGKRLDSTLLKVAFSKENEQIMFYSNVDGLAERLAVLPIGGLSNLFGDDNEGARLDFIQSVAAEAGSVLISSELMDLRKDLQSKNALELLTSQRSLAEFYIRKFPYLDGDTIASELVKSLNRVETRSGPLTFEVGQTSDEEEFLLVGNKLFIVNEEDELIFKEAADVVLTNHPKAPKATAYAHLMVKYIQVLQASDLIPFHRLEGDDKEGGIIEATSPLSDGRFSLSLERAKFSAGKTDKYAYYFRGEKVDSFESFAKGASELTGGFVNVGPSSLTDDITKLDSESSFSRGWDSFYNSINFWDDEKDESKTAKPNKRAGSTSSVEGGLFDRGEAQPVGELVADSDITDSKTAEGYVGNDKVYYERADKLVSYLQ
jgi:hypothetical protein